MKILKISLGFFLILIIALVIWVKPYFDFIYKTVKISPIRALITSSSLNIYNNQVNILVLGIAGLQYEGPDLSDSIILANYDFGKNKLTTVSLPRDVWSDTLRDKINSAYAYGEAKSPNGGGIKLAKAEIAAVVGQPVQYAAVIDFDNFVNFIDTIAGVDVNVAKSFTDDEFPITGKADDLCGGDPKYACRYETISFQKGLQHMNGITALKFVRSRHSQGEEGSDFARSARQQLVIDALKNKMITIVKSLDLNKFKKIYAAFDRSVIRDITNQQISVIARNILFRKKLIQTRTQLMQDFFIVPNVLDYDGKYVLIPANDDYSTVHDYISCYLDKIDPKSCEDIKKTLSR